MALPGSCRSAGGVALLVVTAGCEGRVESAVSPIVGEDHPEVELTVWAPARREDRYWTLGPLLAAERIEENALRVVATNPPGSVAIYNDAVEEALRAGRASDVVFGNQSQIVWWAHQGWLEPLDACFERPGAWAHVLPSLWPAVTWEGKVWGVPVDVAAKPLFFSKTRLRELGWSSAAIASLPERIRTGSFTFDHLLDTAEQAVETGVVAPGFGYWPSTAQRGDLFDFYVAFAGRLDELETSPEVDAPALARAYERMRRLGEARLAPPNLLRSGTATLILDRRLMRDTVAHERVLFWRTWLHDWPRWAHDHVRHRAGEGHLFEIVGVALVPSGRAGKPAALRAWVNGYALTTPRASGRDRAPGTDRAVRLRAACALLERTLRPEMNLLHASESARLSVLHREALAAAAPLDRLLAETAHMVEHLWFLSWRPDNELAVASEIIMDESLAILDGRASPAAAAADAKRRLAAVR